MDRDLVDRTFRGRPPVTRHLTGNSTVGHQPDHQYDDCRRHDPEVFVCTGNPPDEKTYSREYAGGPSTRATVPGVDPWRKVCECECQYQRCADLPLNQRAGVKYDHARVQSRQEPE